MPIGMISGMGNFILNLFSKFFKLITQKPQYLAVVVLFLFFFPLEFVDMFLYLFINLFILILNALIIIFVLLINGIIGVINFTDRGIDDPKYIGSFSPISLIDRINIRVFFTAFSIFKNVLNKLRGEKGITKFNGIEIYC